MNEENAKRYLFDLDDCMKKVGLEYALYGGTCLGAIREQRFIPIDQDIDIYTLEELWLPKWEQLADEMVNDGFEIEIIDHRHVREWDGSCYAIKAKKHGEHGDLNSYRVRGKYRYQASHNSDFYLVHLAKNIEKWKKITFYGREFNVPKYTEAFLTEKYGDWRTPHETFNNISKPTCRKEGDDFWSL